MTKKKNNKQKDTKKQTPKVNADLEGFDIEIDSFGELKTNYRIDKINDFLNKHVEDKKLIDRADYEDIKSGGANSEEEE